MTTTAMATDPAPGTSRTTIEELRSEATVSVGRTAQILGISRTYAYDLVASGALPSIRLGAKRVRVPTAALRQMLGIED
jgi:excisionase family DNA binding protein